ncbi:hypothetical protein FRB98_007004 [Tulasnella sp. 332]|nr:hypothetical protein FRB98_007004 [Tulasnella sp. 332]
MRATTGSLYGPGARSINSVYRLVLRGASAAVLHHKTARDTLRKMYRPTFDDALQQLKRHRDEQLQGKVIESKGIEPWMSSWNQKMDNTLSFLLASATTRGVEHKVTRNLTQLAHFRSRRLRDATRVRQSPWNPRLPSQVYSQVSSGLPLSKKDKAIAGPHLVGLIKRAEEAAKKAGGVQDDSAVKQAQFEDGLWNAIGHITKMAEERSGVALGHARYNRSGELL